MGNVRVQPNYYPLAWRCQAAMEGTASICRCNTLRFDQPWQSKAFQVCPAPRSLSMHKAHCCKVL